MTEAGARTHESILDAAEGLILARGYAATSVDQIIDRVGVTKGTFFYHFRSKSDLARALLERYAAADSRLMSDCLERSATLAGDPLQRILVFVGLFLEVAEKIREPHPGCLFASYCYEGGLFAEEIHEMTAAAIVRWRESFGGMLREAAREYPPRTEVDLDAVADMLTVIFEGSFILSRALREPSLFAAQLRHYRGYLQLLFGA